MNVSWHLLGSAIAGVRVSREPYFREVLRNALQRARADPTLSPKQRRAIDQMIVTFELYEGRSKPPTLTVIRGGKDQPDGLAPQRKPRPNRLGGKRGRGWTPARGRPARASSVKITHPRPAGKCASLGAPQPLLGTSTVHLRTP
jgi:hypothetical protein